LGEFVTFRASLHKLEAVNRISNLTGSGPEELGPGAKERKRVLVNLAFGLGIRNPNQHSKHELLKAILSKYGVPFQRSYVSRGGTITLDGLNIILEIGEQELKNRH
jgi:hypothetical protein